MRPFVSALTLVVALRVPVVFAIAPALAKFFDWALIRANPRRARAAASAATSSAPSSRPAW